MAVSLDEVVELELWLDFDLCNTVAEGTADGSVTVMVKEALIFDSRAFSSFYLVCIVLC